MTLYLLESPKGKQLVVLASDPRTAEKIGRTVKKVVWSVTALGRAFHGVEMLGKRVEKLGVIIVQ